MIPLSWSVNDGEVDGALVDGVVVLPEELLGLEIASFAASYAFFKSVRAFIRSCAFKTPV